MMETINAVKAQSKSNVMQYEATNLALLLGLYHRLESDSHGGVTDYEF
jgi:hypothetical protein